MSEWWIPIPTKSNKQTNKDSLKLIKIIKSTFLENHFLLNCITVRFYFQTRLLYKLPDIPRDNAAGTTDANPSAYEKSTFWSPPHDTVVYPGDFPNPKSNNLNLK